MKIFNYFITSDVIMTYLFSLDYFYYIIHGFIDRKRIKIVLISQFLFAFILTLLKYYNAILNTFIFYGVLLIVLIPYHDSYKEKFIYFISAIFLGGIIENIIAAVFMVGLSIFTDSQYIFVDTLFKEQPAYFCLYELLVVMGMVLFINYLKSVLKSISIKQLKSIALTCFLPFFLILTILNILFVSKSNSFYMIFIISWIVTLFSMFFVFRGINNYQKKQRESIINREIKEITKLQIDQMKSIDQNYRKIRKRNHDFKNHCLIIKEMFDTNNQEVKQYIESVKKVYQNK